ncbi:Tc toxin subunit A [Pseudomonas sp. GL-B-19]|uniref:Tc toxin subunit A n=1 Tax=Pseudomonas sp. GL-B-19 TaxID=2832393 RepID=UPI001CBA9774|nr:Tc toxin subunit A [Pseudomonas sp. GL-B-19]
MDDNTLLTSLVRAYGTGQTNAALVMFFKDTLKFTSVFDIARLTETEFQKQFDDAIKTDNTLKDQASSIDTAKLYDDVKCLATQISHLYLEQRTSVETAQDHWHPLGIRAIEKKGPTYTHLFKENWDDACKNDSIAAIDSPVAYLRALYRFALQLETSVSSLPGEKDNRITLEKRRPDLAALSIDQQSTFTAQPMLGIVNETLDKNIQSALKHTEDEGKSTYEVLAQNYYPFVLPYEFYHHQCLLGLNGNKPTLGELSYLVSESLPLTSHDIAQYGKVLNTGSDQAQRLMSGLGPKQQALLTELPWAERYVGNYYYSHSSIGRIRDSYWKKIYGIAPITVLKNIDTFLERTELKAEQMEALLAQGKYAPCLSLHYLLPAPHSHPFGARYVNGPLSVDDSMALDNEKKTGEIENATEDRLERLHRMIRLQRWLAIPFNQLDTLICSAFESQLSLNTQRQLDSYTIRALGVYRYMSRRYSITAEEFAALLHHVSPYASGDETSLFDKVSSSSFVVGAGSVHKTS